MKTVLVGGASKGLGFGCSLEMAKAGYNVVMCARGHSALEQAVATIQRETGASVVGFPCDWSSAQDIEELKTELNRRQIEIDILVNNIGGPTPGPITELSETDWIRAFDLLFWSTHRIVNLVLAGMQLKNWGRIITISSTAAVEPVRGLASSSVVRAALASYMKLLANELADKGITVNTLLPYGFYTDRTKQLMLVEAKDRAVALEDIKKETEQTLPFKRFLEPEELGAIAVFLASNAAAGITGSMIPVDCGTLKSI